MPESSLKQALIPFKYVTVASKKLMKRRKYLVDQSLPLASKRKGIPKKRASNYGKFSKKKKTTPTPPTPPSSNCPSYYRKYAPNGELLTASDMDHSCYCSTDDEELSCSSSDDYLSSQQYGLLRTEPSVKNKRH